MIEKGKKLNTFFDFRVGDVFDLKFKDKSIAGIVTP
jgi:hypothetical protein